MGVTADKERNGTKKEIAEKVPIYKLFAFADSTDFMLMIIGAVGAIGNGLSMPIMSFIFGLLMNTFGAATKETIVHDVGKVVVKFIYLAIGSGVCSFLRGRCRNEI